MLNQDELITAWNAFFRNSFNFTDRVSQRMSKSQFYAEEPKRQRLVLKYQFLSWEKVVRFHGREDVQKAS